MAASGYEFTIRSSRAALWLAAIGSALGVLLGIGILAAVLMRFSRGTDPELILGATLVTGLLVLLLSYEVFIRSLHEAYECRIGEAGIYLRTLLRQERFVPWKDFIYAEFPPSSLARIRYVGEFRAHRTTWIRFPAKSSPERDRLRIYLGDKARQVSLAIAAFVLGGAAG
jgi:hypothetical protein